MHPRRWHRAAAYRNRASTDGDAVGRLCTGRSADGDGDGADSVGANRCGIANHDRGRCTCARSSGCPHGQTARTVGGVAVAECADARPAGGVAAADCAAVQTRREVLISHCGAVNARGGGSTADVVILVSERTAVSTADVVGRADRAAVLPGDVVEVADCVAALPDGVVEATDCAAVRPAGEVAAADCAAERPGSRTGRIVINAASKSTGDTIIGTAACSASTIGITNNRQRGGGGQQGQQRNGQQAAFKAVAIGGGVIILFFLGFCGKDTARGFLPQHTSL